MSRSALWIVSSVLVVLVTSSQDLLAASSVKKGIPITVEDRDGIDRVKEPVTFAVPLGKKDKVKKTKKLVVEGPDGLLVPAQFRVTQRWGGGPDEAKKPIRWLLVDLQVDVPANSSTTYMVRTKKKNKKKKKDKKPDYPELSVEIDDKAVLAHTGAALFELGGARHGFLESVGLDLNEDGAIAQDERLVQNPPDAGFVLKDRFGATYSSADYDFDVAYEEVGPLRTVVRVTGRHGPTEPDGGIGRDFFLYRTWYTFYAGKPYVRVVHSLRNSYLDDPLGSIGFEAYSLNTSLITGQNVTTTVGIEGGTYSSPGAVRIYQDSDGGDNWSASPNTTFRGFRVYDGSDSILSGGDQAPGYIHFGDGYRGVTMVMREFYPNFPKGFAYDGNGGIRFDIFPEETASWFWLDDGQQKTTDFLLYAHANVNEVNASQAADLFLHELHPLPDPDWTRATGAWGDHGHLATPEEDVEAVKASDDYRDKFVYDDAFNQNSYAYGWSEFGELIWAKNTHTTGSPRNRLTYFDRFMMNGSLGGYRASEVFVLHSRDIRTYHVDGFSLEERPYAILWEALPPWKYSADQLGRDQLDPALDPHRAGIPSVGHDWNAFDFEHMVVDDLYEYYLMTGDPVSRNALLSVAEFIRTFIIYDHNDVGWSNATRGVGWTMRALVKAYQVSGDQRFLDSAEDLMLSVKETYGQDPSPITGIVYHWVFRYKASSKHIPDADYDLPWQMGPYIHGMLLYYRESGDERAKTLALDAADYLVDYCFDGAVMPEAVAVEDHTHVNPKADNTGVNTWIPSALAAAYFVKPRPEYLGVATLMYNSVPHDQKAYTKWIGWSNFHWWHSYLYLIQSQGEE